MAFGIEWESKIQMQRNWKRTEFDQTRFCDVTGRHIKS